MGTSELAEHRPLINAQEIMQEINGICSYIVKSVERFISQQIISTESYRKLNTIKLNSDNILKRAQKIWEVLNIPYQSELAASRQAIEAEFQPKLQVLQQEHQQRAQPAAGNHALANQLNLEYQAKQKSIQQEKAARNQLKTEELEAKHFKVDNKELASLLQELEAVLNQLVETERSITGEEINRKAAQDFAANKGSFDSAVKYHKNMAAIILSVLCAILISGIAVLYVFFVKSNRLPELPLIPSTGTLIVALTTTLSGKVAFLLVWAWVLRRLASLHQIHAEQAVIYNDRSVSLSIAENLLMAAPQLEQKTALLNTMAKGYLDIEKNAFRSENSLNKTAEGSAQLSLIKELVDTVKPLLESLRPKEK